MSPTLQAERDKWVKGRAHFMRSRHLILFPGLAELSISKGDLLFGRRAGHRTGGAEVPDEAGIESNQ
jgi:hypothetical protein